MARKSSYSSPQTQRAQAAGSKAQMARGRTGLGSKPGASKPRVTGPMLGLVGGPYRPGRLKSSQPVKSPMKAPMGKVNAFKAKAQQRMMAGAKTNPQVRKRK